MNTLTLAEIWIYPIKSLAGISLQQCDVKPKGLRYDRRWMLIDEAGVFITQRNNPQMALFQTELDDDRLHVSFSGDSISISLDQNPKGNAITSRIWDDTVEVMEVDKEHSAWFSKKLGLPCQLVSFPEENKRTVDTNYIEGHNVSLADGYPFLIIGEQSLQDLNNRLLEKVDMRRFRPNFVFTGGKPYEEDDWQNFRIGNIHFQGVKKCKRCQLITIDPDTGKKGAEPLKTLATFRASNNKVLFGQNLVAFNDGLIRVGDLITINATN